MKPTIAGVVITRNRIDMLRQTLDSLQASSYPLNEIIVTDDGTDDTTAQMLAREYPLVVWTKGPQRGISANRNHGISIANSDYILLLDDDMVVDPQFVEIALQQAGAATRELFFPAIWENGQPMLPNGLDFLGFSTQPYPPGAEYRTANCQCLVLPRPLAIQEPWDENISVYGYEEMDYAYRVSANGVRIVPLPQCVCIHLAPNINDPFRAVQDASRLYVTYKRYAYIDRRPLKALLFLCIAIPHQVLAMVKRFGLKGLGTALKNFQLAAQMLRRFKHSRAIAAQP